MRSTLIAATFALSVLAAPVPEAKPIYKSGGSECAKVVGGMCVTVGKREPETSVHAGIEARLLETTIRKKDQRDVDDEIKDSSLPHSMEDEKRSPIILHRPKGSRSTADEEELEVGAHGFRGNGKRSIRPGHNKSQQVSSDAEPRTVRGGSWNKRTAEAEPINRIHGGSGPTRWSTRDTELESFSRAGTDKRTAEPEPFDRAGAGRRSAEPEPFGRAGAGKRTAEPEPFDRAGAGRRSAEPEPFGRAGAGKRTAEPEPFDRAGAGRRSAEPEPAVTHGGADAGYRSQTCHPGLISSRC